MNARRELQSDDNGAIALWELGDAPAMGELGDRERHMVAKEWNRRCVEERGGERATSMVSKECATMQEHSHGDSAGRARRARVIGGSESRKVEQPQDVTKAEGDERRPKKPRLCCDAHQTPCSYVQAEELRVSGLCLCCIFPLGQIFLCLSIFLVRSPKPSDCTQETLLVRNEATQKVTNIVS